MNQNSDEDEKLRAFLKAHAPSVPQAPEGEWQRIAARLPMSPPSRPWFVLSFAVSFALLLFLCVPHQPRNDDSEWDEVWSEETMSSQQKQPSYEAWLQLAETIEQQTK